MDELFDLPTVESRSPEPGGPSRPRVQRPNREQVELRAVDLEGLLPPDHRARLVWAFVEGLDLEPLYERIRAVEGEPGRPPIDPAILTALWLYATLEGVGSARALDRLCDEHDAYRWLCGGVSVNYHTLADFRVDHGDLFDRLLTDSVAALIADGQVTLARVAQDSLRVRAAAGRRSFHRRTTLEAAHAAADAQVRALRAELDADPGATTRRVAAARERAARERAERVGQALARLPELAARRAKRTNPHPEREPTASTTDPEATFMSFAYGGTWPGHNAQFATDVGSGIIVGLDADSGYDNEALGPMINQLHARYGRAPAEHLVDQGYRNHDELVRIAQPPYGTTLFMPVRKPRHDFPRDRHRPLRGDRAAVAAWRVRMGTDEARQIYGQRLPAAEGVNAKARNRGLLAVRVRGRAKVRAVLVWFALAHNLLRAATLRAVPVEAG
jgi:transposase